MPAELNHLRRGAGEPLVLIHGIGSRWQVWLPVLDALAAQRDVIAIDLPGFGFSPAPVGVPAGAKSLSRLVAAFLDELGLARPHVAGNSLGGWVALELARTGRAASATGLSPAGFHSHAEGVFLNLSLRFVRAAARFARPDAARLCQSATVRRLAFAQLAAHPERIPPFEAAETLLGLADATWFDETRRALVAERFHSGQSLGVPVTIAWGEHDRLLLPRQAARAAREIPDARMVTLMGCGHVPTYDDPPQVAQVLLAGSAGAG